MEIRAIQKIPEFVQAKFWFPQIAALLAKALTRLPEPLPNTNRAYSASRLTAQRHRARRLTAAVVNCSWADSPNGTTWLRSHVRLGGWKPVGRIPVACSIKRHGIS